MRRTSQQTAAVDGYLALSAAFGLAALFALSLRRNRPIGAE